MSIVALWLHFKHFMPLVVLLLCP